VELELHPNLKPRVQQPTHQLHRLHGAEYGAQQHGEPSIKVVLPHGVDRPIEVAPRGNHELDLIGRDTPSLKACGESHQEHLAMQAVKRTNTQGNPAKVDSP
jgi:hypothetical protein